MDISVVFFLLCLLAFTVFFVLRPFFQGRNEKDRRDNERSSLQAERERLISALSELDFDHSLGKIPAEDYPNQRMALLQRAATVLRLLDDQKKAHAESNRKNEKTGRTGTTTTIALSDDDLEDLLAKHRKTHKGKTSGFCPNCGKPVLQSDAFCPSCGIKIKTNQKD